MTSRTFSASLRASLWVVVAMDLWLGLPGRAVAGGGPENLFLVVNRNSPASLAIANHDVELRGIPPSNVLTLTWDGSTQTARIEAFREKILSPVLNAIEQRRLAEQIDYVVYSSDFPWGINVQPDIDKFLAGAQGKDGQAADDTRQKPDRPRQWPKVFKPTASINGLTYLWEPVLAGDPVYCQLDSNKYLRRPIAEQEEASSLGFKSAHRFGPKGELLSTGGRRYMLSMMLGVTYGCGNSVAEVLNYLGRSAAADGTHPDGTIYFVRNDTIRSKVRDRMFPAAVEQLKELGVKAEIVEGVLPMRKRDVQGAMIGWDKFKWISSGSTILPGAICEHFTSYGGRIRAEERQTPLSEFLRYGAAAASGTVTEPYSVAQKFPLAMVQVHYARGCTVAEAFYQSVYGPYQLLIVGDPLCRPWANIPQVEVEGIEEGALVQGKLTLKPSATVPGDSGVDHFELFVDGRRRAECPVGGSLALDTALLGDGYHELRVVAVEAGPIASQGRKIFDVTTANHGRKITASVTPQGTVRTGQPLVISAASPGSLGIHVLHGSRLLGTISGEQGRLEIDPATVGSGPVRLRVVAQGNGGPTSYAWAKPLKVTVEPGRPAARSR